MQTHPNSRVATLPACQFFALTVSVVLTTLGAARSAEAIGLGASVAGVAVSPLVLRTPAGERAVVLASLRSGALTNVSVQVTAPGWETLPPVAVGDLPAGTNRLELPVPVFTQAAEVTLRLRCSGGETTFGAFRLEPSRRWTVYLTQHTHTDIGYTRPQTEILPEHLRYIDYALDYCDATDGYPEDAQFRWTCETSWAVREYLKRRPAAQIERLKRRVREGRIEIAGMLVNLSEIATESSIAASLRPLRTLQEALGTPVRTAMQNDVNGAAWCLVDYFSDLGIRYLTMGINQTRSILPFDKPTAFWWESPSGKRVLAFRVDHYMTANFWGIEKGDLAKFTPGAVNYLQSLADRKFPFDRIGVQFSGYFTDNSPPSTIACDLVRDWNLKYASPHLRLSTSQEFLAWVEREHSRDLAVHRQAWPDWWTDGFGSAARETAAARETETAMHASQGLLTMAAILGAEIRPGVLERVAKVQDDLIFYAEHTYGAAESIDDPLAENAQVQWGEKAAYVWEAVKESNLLREEALGLIQGLLPRPAVPTLAVFNTLNWSRSGLVRAFVDHEILPPEREFRIVDVQSGEPVPAQPLSRRAEGTYWTFWVKDVPPLGYRTLRIELGPGERSAASAAPNPTTLRNAFYTLVLDRAKGALKSLVDLETGLELVDPAAAWGLGQCVYETLVDRNQMEPKIAARTSLRNVKAEPGAGGPIWQSLRFSADLDGAMTNQGLKGEIRLYNTEKRVEFHFALRKLPVRQPEGVYVVFPFRCPDGRVRYEAQGGSVTPGEDQLPGSASDWQTFQNFVSVRAPGRQIIWGSEGAPLIQLGDFNLGKWQRVARVERPHLYSWVMNNYWFTNFRVEQEGEFHWSYYLTSAGDASDTFATRFGWGSRVPLVARVLPPGKQSPTALPPSMSALTLQGPSLLLVESRPAADGGGIRLHLREVGGKTVTLTEAEVISPSPIQGADEINVVERPLQEGIESLTLHPFETRLVRLQY
jgi:hypothetical protein